jgi:hypothetical protein
MVRMADRRTTKADRAGRMVQLEAENERLRRLEAELAADVGERQAARRAQRSDGAVDPALRLLVGVPPQE